MKATLKQKQKQSVKQETNIKINIGDKGKPKRKYVRRQHKKDGNSHPQYQPNIITISNPPAVSTSHQLPIYYQQQPQPTPFLANTDPTIRVDEHVRKLGEAPKTKIPIVYKDVPVDKTQLAGLVPASFIPQEAPELIKTGGAIENITRGFSPSRKLKFTTYSSSDDSDVYFTEEVPVRIIARQKAGEKRIEKEMEGIPMQSTQPISETLPSWIPGGMTGDVDATKKRRGPKLKYATEEERAFAKRQQTLASNKRRYHERKIVPTMQNKN
jgi:hypothetical protein